MQPGILFLTSNRPIGKLIRWFTKGPVTHVAITLEDHVLHATGAGVVLEPRHKLVSEGYHELAEYLVVPDVVPGLSLALRQVGKGYDVADLVGWPRRVRTPRIPRTDLDRPRWTCTRLVLVLDAGRTVIPEWRHLDAAMVTPTELLATMTGPSFARVR